MVTIVVGRIPILALSKGFKKRIEGLLSVDILFAVHRSFVCIIEAKNNEIKDNLIIT